jgi:putative drug exporter of the RND superfamily
MGERMVSRKSRWSLIAWVAVLIGVAAAAQLVGSDYHNDFALPGTQSQQALDALRAGAPAEAGSTVQIVVQAAAGVESAAVRPRIAAMLAEVGPLPHVAGVGPLLVAEDRTIGYATVTLDQQSEDVPPAAVRTVIDTAQKAGHDGLRVELGGDPVRGAQSQSGGASEGAGLLAALVILVLLFGSLIAAALPIVIAIFAVGSTLGLIALASHLTSVADFTAPLMMLVGLGVGIDYALLVFSRFRAELIGGASRAAAVATAVRTAGRTVLFAGGTVIVALLGLVVLGLGALRGVAVAIALTVLLTMLASLTLLPALLDIAGGRIERGIRRRERPDGTRWARWAAVVQRHKWLCALVPAVALVALAAPAAGMRLGFADSGTDPVPTTSRQAYDLLAEGFGPGFNGPLVVVVPGPDSAVAAARDRLAAVPGVARATTAPHLVLVFPTTAPQDARTAELVTRIRADFPPVLVGGSTAAAVDFADAVAGRLPLFVAVVVGLSMLLLLLVFRSVLIPVKAALLNLLSVGAALGVLTLVFQHGMLGVQPGPIESYVPVMIFAIVFGLSMDYEVFLLARMREEWERSRDATLAVRHGLATTGRVVTAAAAIMIVVFGAFLLSGDRMLEQFGLGLAVAVFLDAAVIRCLLLPALMQLLGRAAWWRPGRAQA